MSVQSLKSEIDGRCGRDLLPPSFPIELLISITRKLAAVTDSAIPPEELEGVAALLRAYLGRVIGINGASRLHDFDLRVNDLIPQFARELYECMFEEIVSRLIEHDVRSVCLQDRLLGVLDDAEGKE